VFAVDI